MRKLLIGLAVLFVLSGCANFANSNTFTQKLASRVTPVDMQYRPLRICLLATGVIEVMTDRVQAFDGEAAPEALGRLIALQGAIDTVKLTNPLWPNTNMADVVSQFAMVLKDVGKSRLRQTLIEGPTVANFVNVAKRATLLASKGKALLLDINSILSRVQAGTLSESEAWAACNERIAMNRRVLGMLGGARM